jgi:cephalosporin hydroxylase
LAEVVNEKEGVKGDIGGKTVLGAPVERFKPREGTTKAQIIEDFHKLSYSAAYEEGLTWNRTQWLGFPLFKMPSDLLTLVDIIWQTKPRLIIETGTAAGGSALFMASFCDAVGAGKILTIDFRPVDRNYPAHPRIAFLGGRSSVDPELLKEVEGYVDYYGKDQFDADGNVVARGGAIMVVLDSDHAKAHVLKEMEAYGKFVTPGAYMVVEDTDVNGHPVLLEHGPGPFEAVEEFLPKHPEFKIDDRVPKWQLFSYHTWLRKGRT